MEPIEQPWLLFFALMLVPLFAVEIGTRLGERTSVATDTVRHEQLSASRDAIGILLSLLLGFTLAMAVSRFDQRKQLIVDEANSIGTTALPAPMLTEPARGKMLALIREYVNTRIRFSEAPLLSAEFNQATTDTKNLQNAMWEQSVDIAKATPNAITGLFIDA